jgi:dihydroxyacetone kinase-like protein
MNTDYLLSLLKEYKLIMAENRDYLISLDSVVGDGDLGLTMGDGFAAAYEAVRDGAEKDAGKLLYTAGKAMSTAVPSTMGTLMASGLMQAGKVLKGKTELEPDDLLNAFQAYQDGVQNRGKAQIGDKTFLDGWAPAVEAVRAAIAAGEDMKAVSAKAYEAAEKGFKNTTAMIAKHGRAATRGEASRALEDPGAAVAMLLMKAFLKSFS